MTYHVFVNIHYVSCFNGYIGSMHKAHETRTSELDVVYVVMVMFNIRTACVRKFARNLHLSIYIKITQD